MKNTLAVLRLVGVMTMAGTFLGCATDIGGFSSLDASPTPKALQVAEQARQVYLTRVTEVLNRIHKGSLDANAKAPAKQVLLKLKDLDSVTEMGVSYREYPTYIREAKFTINRFSSEFAEQKELTLAFQLCLDPYVQAQSYFGEYIKMRKGTMGEGEYRFYLQDRWKTGHETIRLVESHLPEF